MVKSKYKGVWLHKLKDGDITFYIQYIDNKKRNRKIKIGRKSEGISEHWCSQKRNEIIHKTRLENFSLDEKKDAPLFDEVAFKYFQSLFDNQRSVENTESTIVRYKKHVQEYVGHRSILDIDIAVLNKIKRDKIQILAPRTVNGYLSLISTIINYGNRTLDLQIKNHVNNRNVTMFKEDNIRECFLSKDEINLLLENVKNYRQVNLATRFALATETRLGTILSIKVRDINTVTRVIKLTDHKSGGDRYNSYLHEKYFPDFKFLDGRKPSEWIFSYKGNRIEGASVQLQFRVIANRLFNDPAGLDKDDRKHRVVFHTLRHTFCSQLCIAGVEIYADHHGYIPRVNAAIDFLGYDSNKLEVLLAQMVSLLKDGEPYKMSKRAGNVILMSDIVEEIGSDALRFIFASKKSDTALEFDLAEFKKQDSSNPIFYIQYAHARIQTLLSKATVSKDEINASSLKNLGENADILLFDALLLPEIVEDAFSSRQVQKLPDYLKALAASLHKFYYDVRMIGTEDEAKLLKVLLVVALSLKTGLSLMGIEAKDRMSKEEEA